MNEANCSCYGVRKIWKAVNRQYADWSQPTQYAELCMEAVAGREVLGVLVWVHQPHRDAVTRAIEPLLSQAT